MLSYYKFDDDIHEGENEGTAVERKKHPFLRECKYH